MFIRLLSFQKTFCMPQKTICQNYKPTAGILGKKKKESLSTEGGWVIRTDNWHPRSEIIFGPIPMLKKYLNTKHGRRELQKQLMNKSYNRHMLLIEKQKIIQGNTCMQKFTSRWDCCISPCKARAPGNNPESSFADSLFSVKIIVRPPLK